MAAKNQAGETDDDEHITWMLVSSNNRPLGRGKRSFDTYDECRIAALGLRAEHAELRSGAVTTEQNGHWAWRVDRDGQTIAVSTRTYLRQRECVYNLDRFFEALPLAEATADIRRIGRRRH